MGSTITTAGGHGFEEGDLIKFDFSDSSFKVDSISGNTVTIRPLYWRELFQIYWKDWCKLWRGTFPYFSSNFITPEGLG